MAFMNSPPETFFSTRGLFFAAAAVSPVTRTPPENLSCGVYCQSSPHCAVTPRPPSRPVRPERRAGRLLRGHPEAGHHVVAVRPGEEGLRIEAQGVTERQRHILTGL